MHDAGKFLVVLMVVVTLGGCGLLDSRKKDREAALDNFMKYLRYQLYPAAASHFCPDLRDPFLDQVEQIKGLNVTDVRLVRVDVSDEGARVDARLEMDYYLLPSVTVKTLRINQGWRYRDDPRHGAGFCIDTPFPSFP